MLVWAERADTPSLRKKKRKEMSGYFIKTGVTKGDHNAKPKWES